MKYQSHPWRIRSKKFMNKTLRLLARCSHALVCPIQSLNPHESTEVGLVGLAPRILDPQIPLPHFGLDADGWETLDAKDSLGNSKPFSPARCFMWTTRLEISVGSNEQTRIDTRIDGFITVSLTKRSLDQDDSGF